MYTKTQMVDHTHHRADSIDAVSVALIDALGPMAHDEKRKGFTTPHIACTVHVAEGDGGNAIVFTINGRTFALIDEGTGVAINEFHS